jgi:tRNA(Ile)-lysidine synthase
MTVVEPAQAVFHFALVSRAAAWMPRDTTEAVFDATEIGAGLWVRNFRPGDRIVPLGMSGSRKVKDVFIQHKIPTEDRKRFPVVSLEGRVAWLPGLVRSNLAMVTSDTTKIVRLSVTSGRCLELNPRATV